MFTPKYRRKAIYNQYRKDLGEILGQLRQRKGVEIIEGHLMPDRVRMLVSIPPKVSVSSFMGYPKGESSPLMFDRHANLKYKFGNRKLWAGGCYVSAVGPNEATIAKHIREQEGADIAQDRLSVKEYEDPYRPLSISFMAETARPCGGTGDESFSRDSWRSEPNEVANGYIEGVGDVA